ncbi:MOSC N-terminal beta barrel domain-containing protein [Streptomyces sp. RFCAC02]|uniref:MOSC domain-containing protein n=1 Tax=Streptomyces sp. RFCAC02 TaxID=2499143 RepID=UPI0010206598|nr:MOSC N-terminal beta barrel domain-containing protein [Streptomyces sp. RFCAC02]
MPRVASLTTYPIKGCAGVTAPVMHFVPAGAENDRVFMVVDGEGAFRNQRHHPELALLRPAVAADGARLTVEAPGLEPLDIPVVRTGPVRGVTLFGKPFGGVDQGDEAAAWVSEALGAPRRLVRVPPDHARETDGLTPGTSGYADSSAVHLLSEPSLHELNTRIADGGGAPLPMDRFRPNIVITGWPEPGTEDRILEAVIGGVRLGWTKAAGRCVVTLVDQAKGLRCGPEPLRTLAHYRRAATGGGVLFGAKFSVMTPGAIAVGDEIEVIRWASEGTGDPGRTVTAAGTV